MLIKTSSLAVVLAALFPLSAYRPPVDTAGPLTARIEGPQEITRNDAPVEIAVVLENSGDAVLSGAVQLRVIDRWQVTPASARFSVPAKGTTRLAFNVRLAAITFSAHYPIHAFAEFEFQGQRLRAQPILVVPVRLADPPRPQYPTGITPPAPRPATAPPPPTGPPPGTPRTLGAAGGYQVRVWPGERGLLDSTFGFEQDSERLYFKGFLVRALGASLEDPHSPVTLAHAREETAAGRYRVRHRFNSWAGPFDLLTEAWVERGALRTRFAVENAVSIPWVSFHLEDVAAGPWTAQTRRIYAGQGNVVQDPKAFRLRYNGHFLSTSFIGIDFQGGISIVQGVDVPPDHLAADPTTQTCSLHTPHNQILSFIPTRDVWAGVKTFRDLNPPRAAPAVPRLAGRFTFDLWRGRYADSARALRQAFRYGLTDAVVIWHRWQRWGYDYRLPDIYPPSTEYGTIDEFRELVAACKNNGVLFAPHDNYIDFYPDSDDFTYDNMAFTADRKPQSAFFNRGAGAQSYHPRSDRVMPFVQRNIREIFKGFAPGAYFIDVWSSEPPYDYYTSEGKFFDRVHTRDVWRQAFAWIRENMGGAPQISEAGADQYIGWMDGAASAHMRAEGGPERSNVWRIENSGTERVPWFDAAYHDVLVLQGAGYPGRYNSGQDNRAHGMYSDDYITTEVMTGHPSMVWDAFTRDTVRKYWLLHDLMRGLSLRRMEKFTFAAGDIHRHEIRWDNGSVVWVNRGESAWNVNGHELPQYGFSARVPAGGGTLEGAIERRDGLVVEWSKSPSMLYVNARPVVPEPPARGGAGRGPQGPDPRLPRMNPDGRQVNFGAISTNGGARLKRSDDALEVTPLPNGLPFTLTIRWRDLPWKLAAPTTVDAVAEDGSVIRSAPVGVRNSELTLQCDTGVFAYRLR